MSGAKLVWPDEVVGCCTSLGRIVCAPCVIAGIKATERPESYVYAGETYSDHECETCGVRLDTLATYWTPPDFPQEKGRNPPSPGFTVQADRK